VTYNFSVSRWGAKFVERVDEKKGQRSLFQGQAAL
jgi:hypothetical protein